MSIKTDTQTDGIKSRAQQYLSKSGKEPKKSGTKAKFKIAWLCVKGACQQGGF